MPIDERELRRVKGPGGLIADDRRCRRCSYQLKGLRDDARCPECGTPITTIPQFGPGAIPIDRPCGQCRYNLKGLPPGGRCPECGTPYTTRGGRHRFVDSLADAPLFYLKTLAFGTTLLAVCSILGWWAFARLDANRDMRSAALAGLAALGWCMGVYIATGRRYIVENTLADAVLDSPRLRLAIRAANVAWLLAVVFWVLALRSAPPADRIAWQIAVVLQTVGCLGIIPLAILLSCLSDWAGDTGLGDRFRISAWALAICGLIVAVAKFTVGFKAPTGTPGIAAGFLFLNSIWATLVILVACLLFLFCLAQLAYISLWAIFNSTAAAASARRIMEMRQRDERAMAERTHKAGTLAGDNPGYKRPIPSRPRAAGPGRGSS